MVTLKVWVKRSIYLWKFAINFQPYSWKFAVNFQPSLESLHWKFQSNLQSPLKVWLKVCKQLSSNFQGSCYNVRKKLDIFFKKMVWIQKKGEFHKKKMWIPKKNCSEVVLDTKMFKNNMINIKKSKLVVPNMWER